MPRKDYGEYRWAMTQLFAAVDPVGLVGSGAPIDEYEPEITELLTRRRPVSPERVRDVFVDMLGLEDGDIASADAVALADGIQEIRTKFGYEVEADPVGPE